MQKIYQAPNQIDAEIIKGRLEAEGIKVSISPDSSEYRGRFAGTMLHASRWDVNVEDDDIVKTRELLKDFLPTISQGPKPIKSSFKLVNLAIILILIALALYVWTH